MTTIAVFPGQGAQTVGMGRALYEALPVAREVFQAVDDALGFSLSKIAFDGPADTLTLTENAQPALMATSLAAFRALEQILGAPLGTRIDFVAGHSLGEYSALVAAGALDLGAAARLLRLRGQAMQRAVPAGQGAMAAVLGLPTDEVEALARSAAARGVCELANDNSDGQAVLSGDRAAVEYAVDLAKSKGARRAVLLDVSAPFHCSLMAGAADELAPALRAAQFSTPAVPLIANVTAAPARDPAVLPDLLVRQVTGRVRWRESMVRMREEQVSLLIEFGAGKVLGGMAKRALPDARILSVQTPDDVAVAAEALAQLAA
ncbi:[Acyl-carrier-protein] S-malonyltransferase [Arboricoccus pini]|uniref:Malonyl CoA-acyl carrier protein transacylase n=1 Tax=Arboricoccus pini TaxID=1963835 RepID=A0A212QSH8_9PROT|nr:ACP S-malonyltransferase [Arboricoccus pini]SNB62464.1 [Acyl-carrier-protein] S-malonyltransferase [Arboricoccus pini]